MAESFPPDDESQRFNDLGFEPTQLSQPQYNQTQNTQGTFINSQVEPRRKYWAVLIPTNAHHAILKIPWSRPHLQIGRGSQPQARNDVVLSEKRISNIHCRVTLGVQGENGSETSSALARLWKEGDGEPEVWIEDLKSSNGTFVNGERVRPRRLLQHGDEISLGHAATLENHDARYIFRSVGQRGARFGKSVSKGGVDRAGEVYERYQFLDSLGKGSFAEVRKAVDVETGDLRAIKQIIKYRFAANPKTMDLFQREIDICQRLQHENICRLIEWYEDPQHICLVLEYVDGGDLLDYVMRWPNLTGGGLPETDAADFAVQICRAMAYTHEQGVTHRDLKPENILLTKATAGQPMTIKIADFGLAKMVHAETMLTSMVGTPQYLAPEVVMQSAVKPGYENKVDSWSVGIVVYSMMTKALPFEEDGEMPVEKRIKMRYTQPFDSALLYHLGIGDLAIDFIGGLLAKDPANRLSMKQALHHEWLAGPSSQRSASQILRLGGDSEWSIEAFDDDAPHIEGDAEDGQWSRPMTVSATNYESAAIDSDESFSQPMGNLRLATAAISNLPPVEINYNEDREAEVHRSERISRQQFSPPSPALTADRNEVAAEFPFVLTGSRPPLTPAASNSKIGAQKRKQGGRDAKTRDLFSSGSLSPAPDEKARDILPTAGANAAGAEGEKMKVTVRHSARMAARPRKSMRLS